MKELKEDSAWGPMMMFGVTGPGPKADRKPVPSDPKKEKGINIKNFKKMKKLAMYEDFINESQELNEGLSFLNQLKFLRGSILKTEEFAKKNGEDLSDIRLEYTQRLRGVISEVDTRNKQSDEAVGEFVDKLEGALSISEMVDFVEFYGQQYGINESVVESIVNEAWQDIARSYTLKISEFLRKGFEFTVEKIIIPFVKYLLNVLSRLIVNIVIAIVNSITGKTYKAPDATIFKKDEISSSMVQFNDNGYKIDESLELNEGVTSLDSYYKNSEKSVRESAKKIDEILNKEIKSASTKKEILDLITDLVDEYSLEFADNKRPW